MITRQLRNKVTTIIGLSQTHTTSTKDPTHSAEFIITQSNNEKLPSSESAKIQASDDCRNSINLPDNCGTYRDGFIRMLQTMRSTWHGCFRHTTSPTDRVKLYPQAAKPIHSGSYRARPKAREFEKNEMDDRLSINVYESARNECASSVVFALNKDGSFHFCMYYWKRNAVIVRVSYFSTRVDV